MLQKGGAGTTLTPEEGCQTTGNLERGPCFIQLFFRGNFLPQGEAGLVVQPESVLSQGLGG